jgi:hypothetical protein
VSLESIQDKLAMTGARSLGLETYALLEALFATALALAYLDLAESQSNSQWYALLRHSIDADSLTLLYRTTNHQSINQSIQ